MKTIDKKEEEEKRFDGGTAKTNDPVRVPARKMGSEVAAHREGEVEIAKRIEEGERRVLQVVLNLVDCRRRNPRSGRAAEEEDPRVKDVVRDLDEDADFEHTERVIKIIDRCVGFSRNEKIIESWNSPRVLRHHRRRLMPPPAPKQGH